ncbi:scarecrow-like protein 32 [Selaginella moellendorffii]|uniref:scarecrow-like protein 32 n=1 Tax=Selaginella moellendorffii TaxID=88036 RepID=UPI000D1CDD6B|nr:scarecrow-like protein 32 [Selaginella moellendorffii]|eukprot:XP_024544610.1 scarecrow-like protein 32 [Selaginella moellendorffii]
MLRQSVNYQLPAAATSCSRSYLDSRELAFLSKEEHSSPGPERYYYNTPEKLKNNTTIKEAWPLSGLSVRGISILRGSNDAACVEQLLLHCATALESSDTTFAQQIMWVLNNIAAFDGDPNQRVAAWFLKALVSRVSRTLLPFSSSPPRFLPSSSPTAAANTNLSVFQDSCLNLDASSASCFDNRLLTPIQLAKFVDLTPWHRFGFSAANGAILEAVQSRDKIHILDLSITHCMQWPTLIESLSNRPGGPPNSVRLSVLTARPSVPPFVDMPYEELGTRLRTFARSKRVNLEFEVVSSSDLIPGLFQIRDGDEALVVNCQLRLHYFPEIDDHDDPHLDHHGLSSPRDEILHLIRSLNPDMVTLVEEDADVTSPSLVDRLRAAYNHLWIPFDLLESCLARNHELRLQYEADVGRKIDNIVACEGEARIERLESRDKWNQRMRFAGFRQLGFCDEVWGDVKWMLEQHATGWGLKRDAHDLLLTWKGHNVVFATAWTTG